ncbi:MAG: DoxX family membrane protein [Solirubrobacterales bacterium]|nr:DoxX family membrane protein [Solirubrobacterales bacterium]
MRRLDAAIEADPPARRTAIVVGAVFIVASLPKFLLFGFELEQFERFGLPFPAALVLLVGVIELAGGLALLLRRAVAPALAVLIPTMLAAIVSSGILEGDVVPSLTVAPALLAGMGYLAVRATRSG